MGSKHRPQRTCVVCRKTADKRDLHRIVWTEDGIHVDLSGKMNGRGAYLCDDPQCWERAASTPVLATALRTELSIDDRSYLRQIKPS